MPNPFGPFQNPRMHGLGKAPRAGARRGGNNPLTDALYWYDLTDQGTVWADGAGTIPISNGVNINRVDDKGSVGHDIIDVIGPTFPQWFTAGGLNGLARFTSASSGLTGGVPPVLPGPDGCSYAQVVKRENSIVTTHAGFYNWNGSGNAGINFQFFPTNACRQEFMGMPFTNFTTSGIVNEWYWVIAAIDALGNWRAELSGFPPVSGVGVYDPTPTNLFLSPGSGTSGHECRFWDYPFTLADFAVVQAEFEAKYGGVFPQP